MLVLERNGYSSFYLAWVHAGCCFGRGRDIWVLLLTNDAPRGWGDRVGLFLGRADIFAGVR